MSSRYSHLLSPVQVGGVLLRNRMTATAALPHFIQGTEPFPTEKWITMMANRARNGAAGVYINHLENGSPQKMGIEAIANTPGHFSIMDMSDSSTHNYLCQMIDAVRYYGALAITGPMGTYTREGGPGGPGGPGGGPGGPGGPGGDDDDDDGSPAPQPMRAFMADSFTKSQMQEFIDSTCKNALLLKQLGFEFFSFHNAYRGGPCAQLWSPLCNHRTDEYGGSVYNRARFLLEYYDAIRQTLGPDFPIEVLVSGTEINGITVQDTIELAKLLEGKVDLLSIRNGEQDPQHPVGYTSTRQNPWPNADVTKAVSASVRERGGKLLIGATAGLHDADFCNNVIKEGYADVICMARSWICDSEYGKKLYEGRGEDVTPCVRCNKCHVPNDSDKFRSFCTVNPLIGLEDKIERMTVLPGKNKNIAVVGGGPGGMYAAITAAERGHKVTLFEQSPELGGQLVHTKYASFKWPLEDYKDFLIRKCYKTGVDVKVNTLVTKELLEKGNYTDVIVAIGPEFTRPNIPGANGANVMFAVDVFGHESELPENVVVIGGSETGVEAGMYLCENGHSATVMTRQSSLASDAAHAHFVSMLTAAWQALPNFKPLTRVKYTSIDETGVNYTDRKGNEHHIDADLVVLATGAKATPEACASLFVEGPKYHYIGDCFRVGNVHMAVTAGFGAANQI